MNKKVTYLIPILLAATLALVSSCRPDSGLYYYYSDNSNGTGGGNGGGGNGCCCCNDNQPSCDSAITVTDENGVPIQNAGVTVFGDNVDAYITDINGETSALDLTSGDYTIEVVASGYDTGVQNFSVSDGICPAINLGLSTPNCDVSFFIKIKSGVSNQPLTFTLDQTLITPDPVTDQYGVATVPGVTPGHHTFDVRYVIPNGGNFDTYVGIGSFDVITGSCPGQITVTMNLVPR